MKHVLRFAILASWAVGTSVGAQSVPEIAFDAKADLFLLPPYGEVAGGVRGVPGEGGGDPKDKRPEAT